MGIEISDGAIHLAENGDAFDSGALGLQPRGDIRQLLAHRGGRRSLAMGVRQHRCRGMSRREAVEHAADVVEHGQQQGRPRALQHQRVGSNGGGCERRFLSFSFRRVAGTVPAEDCILGVVADVTDRVLLARELEQAQADGDWQAELLLLRSDGLSYEEVASALELNPGSVGTLLGRAQRAFRKEYLKRYGTSR